MNTDNLVYVAGTSIGGTLADIVQCVFRKMNRTTTGYSDFAHYHVLRYDELSE